MAQDLEWQDEHRQDEQDRELQEKPPLPGWSDRAAMYPVVPVNFTGDDARCHWK